MKVLITGSNGLLGQKIVAQLLKNKILFTASSRGENRNHECPAENYYSLDITSKTAVNKLLEVQDFTAIVNTAAMTNVDQCEADSVNCQRINVDGLRNLFAASKCRNIHLIQISTDFVFDGENGPYLEDDKRNPLSVYAISKRDAEDILLLDNYENWSILRTIILYGKGNNLSRSNIVLWAIESLRKGIPINIVNDQFRAPTWVDDLAWACIRTAELNAKGVYHISGPEMYSIFELVCKVADFYQLDKSLISPVSSTTLNEKAKRPPKTGFDISKAHIILGYRPLKIEESLQYMEP